MGHTVMTHHHHSNTSASMVQEIDVSNMGLALRYLDRRDNQRSSDFSLLSPGNVKLYAAVKVIKYFLLLFCLFSERNWWYMLLENCCVGASIKMFKVRVLSFNQSIICLHNFHLSNQKSRPLFIGFAIVHNKKNKVCYDV